MISSENESMNKARLLACPSCSRHVRSSERACPFCQGEIPAAFATAPAPRGPTQRLSRAALYAFSATSLGLATGLATACSSSAEPLYGGVPVSDAASTDGAQEGATAQPLYGAPGVPLDASMDDSSEDAEHEAATGQPLYGASFPLDAESDAASDAPADAIDEAPTAQPSYGAGFPFDAK
jgi:hypothetical protein